MVVAEGLEFLLGWLFILEPLRLELGRPKASDLAPRAGGTLRRRLGDEQGGPRERARGKRSRAQLRTWEDHFLTSQPNCLAASAFFSGHQCPLGFSVPCHMAWGLAAGFRKV